MDIHLTKFLEYLHFALVTIAFGYHIFVENPINTFYIAIMIPMALISLTSIFKLISHQSIKPKTIFNSWMSYICLLNIIGWFITYYFGKSIFNLVLSLAFLQLWFTLHNNFEKKESLIIKDENILDSDELNQKNNNQ